MSREIKILCHPSLKTVVKNILLDKAKALAIIEIIQKEDTDFEITPSVLLCQRLKSPCAYQACKATPGSEVSLWRVGDTPFPA